MTVEHPKYGTGTVVRREGDGEDAKITVNFPRFGLKKLVEKYVVEGAGTGGGGGGEYPLQDGFGWTNGVTLKLLDLYSPGE